jgi:hypothetical protein
MIHQDGTHIVHNIFSSYILGRVRVNKGSVQLNQSFIRTSIKSLLKIKLRFKRDAFSN